MTQLGFQMKTFFKNLEKRESGSSSSKNVAFGRETKRLTKPTTQRGDDDFHTPQELRGRDDNEMPTLRAFLVIFLKDRNESFKTRMGRPTALMIGPTELDLGPPKKTDISKSRFGAFWWVRIGTMVLVDVKNRTKLGFQVSEGLVFSHQKTGWVSMFLVVVVLLFFC